MHLTKVETPSNVRRPLCYTADPDAPPGSDADILAILLSKDNICEFSEVDISPLECDTTNEVTVRVKGRDDRGKLSEVPTGVTLEHGTATWQFTTVAC
jgi:hypothetical protein